MPLLQEVSDAAVLAAGAVVTLIAVLAAKVCLLRRRSDEATNGGAVGKYQDRNYVAHEDLVDPSIRGDHLAFNAHLHERFAGQRFVPVKGEPGCFIAFGHATCKDVMNDHATFSSNPFAEDRLVALNTMSKADHARVLRYVHSHYSQAEVGQLQGQIDKVVERCTDELERGETDVVTWAKRIHMTSTLARLGVDWTEEPIGHGEQAAWRRVDEVIALNDAMVYLVAPLGGIGARYSTVPRGQWFWILVAFVRSLLPTLEMAYRFGIRCTWEIIRPDVTVLWPPAAPRMGLWWHPELVPLVPKYFLSLYELLHSPTTGGPLAGIREGVQSGNLKLEEALTLMVQNMVNMTSANALANLVFRLATEEAVAKQLAEDPSLCSAFIQEVLRLDAPLQRNPRRVARPLAGKWKDAPMREGDHVLLLLGAANMDPAVYDAPGEFRLGRTSGDKGAEVTFGSGIHYCLGSYLVKLELRTALECLLRRFDSVQLQGSYLRLVDVDVGNWGFRELGVQLRRKVDA